MSARSSAKIRRASARTKAASAGPGAATSMLATTQRTVTGWPRTAAIPASMPGRRRSACVLEERLLLREAEGHDGAIDGDRPAGDDQRLGRRVRAELVDDGRPGREQLVERRAETPRTRGRRPAVRARGRRGGGRRPRRRVGLAAGACRGRRGSVVATRSVGAVGPAGRRRVGAALGPSSAPVGGGVGAAGGGVAAPAVSAASGAAGDAETRRRPRCGGVRRPAGVGREQRELELEAEAADAGAVRVDGSRRPAAARAAGS